MCPPPRCPLLPVACAMGAMGALREAGCPGARLKWPNDIVVGGRKLAGVLTELAMSDEGAFAVCGIGVNIETPSSLRVTAPWLRCRRRDCATPSPPGPPVPIWTSLPMPFETASSSSWRAGRRPTVGIANTRARIAPRSRRRAPRSIVGSKIPCVAEPKALWRRCLPHITPRWRLSARGSASSPSRARSWSVGCSWASMGMATHSFRTDGGIVDTYDAVDVCIRPA
ncbi:MAG: biotin--[acetyl-CoA-carboxylase] ligase [Collinsella sp.]